MYAYDIQLEFTSFSKGKFELEFHLKQRPDKCMVCNLTYGLPEVFERHPIINIKGLTKELEALFKGIFKLGNTEIERICMQGDRILGMTGIFFTLSMKP